MPKCYAFEFAGADKRQQPDSRIDGILVWFSSKSERDAWVEDADPERPREIVLANGLPHGWYVSQAVTGPR